MDIRIKIDLSNFKDIIWPAVALYLIQYLNILSNKQAFILYSGIVMILVMYMGKIVIPRVKGLLFYLIFIIYSSVVGLVLYEVRDVARDLFYVLPTIVLIVIGYYAYIIYGNKLSMMKTIVFSTTILSTITFFKLLMNISVLSSFSDIRGLFTNGAYEVAVAFMIIFTYVFVKKEDLFGKWFQRYSLCVMFGHIILSLARSTWIEVIAGCLLIVFFHFYSDKDMDIIIKASKIVIALVVGMAILVAVAPKSVTRDYTDKIKKSITELNAEQTFSSVEDVMDNWRAYEIQMAEKQWKESSAIVATFGEGMGKGVKLKYIPYTWGDMVEENNEIPLLHNAYYTILPKGGLVGVVALIWFMLAHFIAGIKYLKRKKGIYESSLILISISAIFLIHSYIVRGPVTQYANITWGLLIGWIGAEMSRGVAIKRVHTRR